jgi:putative flippase GtrA
MDDATLSASPDAAHGGSLRRRLALVGRHQVGSAIATAVDFTTMVLLVRLCGVGAPLAAVSGASMGAIVNFHLGRRWIFRATTAPMAAQALRYALVSATSAGLNGLGELALSGRGHLHYLAARAMVAVAVSLAWNLPMQRRFVFGAEDANT